MDQSKIIIASSKEVLAMLADQLSVTAFHIADTSLSGNETLRKAAFLLPDLIITDYSLTDMTGIELAQAVEDLKICPVVILATPEQSEYIEELKKDSLDIFCLTKPLDSTVLNHMLSLVIRLTKRMHGFERKIDELEHKLEDRKLIDKAKGLLMEKFNLTEDQAYKQMRQKAMNMSKPVSQIAKSIVGMLTPSKKRD